MKRKLVAGGVRAEAQVRVVVRVLAEAGDRAVDTLRTVPAEAQAPAEATVLMVRVVLAEATAPAVDRAAAVGPAVAGVQAAAVVTVVRRDLGDPAEAQVGRADQVDQADLMVAMAPADTKSSSDCR